MALRLLEMNVPEEHVNDIVRILEENNIADFWQTCDCQSNSIFRIIMPAQSTENLLNIMETRYGHLPDFHAILLALEATVPGIKEMDTKAGEAQKEKAEAPSSADKSLRVSRQELYASEAFLLLVTNTICINIAGVVTFLVQGIQPAHWWEAKKAKIMTYKAVALWTVLLLVLLVIILLQPPEITPTAP